MKALRKLVGFLCTACLLLALVPAASAAPMSVDDLEVGYLISGFELMEVRPFETLGSTVLLFEHRQSGAQLMYVANDDIERAFTVSFRTNAENDKGIPHVFEHSALSGSEKYPSSSLFFEMTAQTYNTYLNALTYPSNTAYPSASLSEDQLYQFVDFYLSGVFEPLVLTDERAMMREAYRYELTDAEADLNVTGIVYSEMQGALSSLDTQTYYAARKLLYPGSYRTNESGGDPEDIVTMTHQEIKDFHEKYYHPSNCLMVLYGDVNYARFLRLIDSEYLNKYTRQEVDLTDYGHQPYIGHREEVVKLPATADATVEDSGYIFYGIALEGCTLEETELASVVATAFNMESSPLQQLAKERLPKASVYCMLDTDLPVPTLFFYAYNMNESDKDAFKALVDEAIAQTAADGIDPAIIDALVKSLTYGQLLSGEDTTNLGVNFGTSVAHEWGLSGNVWAYMEQSEVLGNIADYAADGSIDAIVTNYLVSPVHSALLVGVPEPGLAEAQEAARLQTLADRKAAMTPEEIEALVQATAEFNAWNESDGDDTLIGEIKAVDPETLPEEYVAAEVTDTEADGVRSLTSVISTEGIASAQLLIDACEIPFDMLHDYVFYTYLLGSLPTENYSSTELQQTYLNLFNTFSISAGGIVYAEDGHNPYLTIDLVALTEDLEQCYALIEEMLCRTDFSDIEYIRNLAYQFAENYKLSVSSAPYQLAYDLACAALDEDDAYYYYLSGIEFYNYLSQVAAMTDEEMLALTERLSALPELLLQKDGAIITCVADEAGIAENDKYAAELLDTFGSDGQHTPQTYDLPDYPDSIAVVIDGTVQYNAVVVNTADTGLALDGGMFAMSLLTGDQLLIPTMRYQNGVYSVLHDIGRNNAYIISYRDPGLAETYSFYEQVPQLIGALELTDEVLEGYIISAYTSLSMPTGPIANAQSAITSTLIGLDPGRYVRYMQELKDFSLEDVETYTAIYTALAEQGVRVTVGGSSAIQANSELFDTIITLSESQSGGYYVDVTADHKYFSSIQMGTEYGFFNGVGDSKFDPEGNTTNAMLWTVLTRLFGVQLDPSEPWYDNARLWVDAATGGMIGGDDPEAAITRQDLAVTFYTFASLLGADLSAGEAVDLLAYSDGAEVAEEARAAMQWACAIGLFTDTDGSILPGAAISRGEFTAITLQYLMSFM